MFGATTIYIPQSTNNFHTFEKHFLSNYVMETSKVIFDNSARNVPLRDIQTGFGATSNFVKKYEIFK